MRKNKFLFFINYLLLLQQHKGTKRDRVSGDSELKLTAKSKSFGFYLLSLSSYQNQGANYLKQCVKKK